MPHSLRSTRLAPKPAVEAGIDGQQHFGECREVTIVRREAPGQFPDSLDWGELWAVRRQKQQPQPSRVPR